MFAHFFRSLAYFVAATAAGGWSAINTIDWQHTKNQIKLLQMQMFFRFSLNIDIFYTLKGWYYCCCRWHTARAKNINLMQSNHKFQWISNKIQFIIAHIDQGRMFETHRLTRKTRANANKMKKKKKNSKKKALVVHLFAGASACMLNHFENSYKRIQIMCAVKCLLSFNFITR